MLIAVATVIIVTHAVMAFGAFIDDVKKERGKKK
jgi:hypothetical protein